MSLEPSTQLRILMLATYFPKPLNPLMGTWALSQAKAIRRAGASIEVVSPTAWVPKCVAWSNGAKAYALSPIAYDWDGLAVSYPRWLLYPVGPMRRPQFSNPKPFLELGLASLRRWLDRKIEAFRPQVIYAHHSAVNGYLADWLRMRYGLPYVVTDHDFGEISSCECLPGRRRVFETVAAGASQMVSVASRMEREVRRLFPNAHACTVHNGTDPIPTLIHARPRPDNLKGKTILFSCGMFYKRKAFPLLVDVFAKVSRKHPNAILRIAGDGAEREAVEARIRHHQIEGRVHLLGSLCHDEVLQEMVWADLFVLLGWDEPFATVFSEAASAGNAILCCNDGGFNDVLVHERHGLAVPPHDEAAAAAAMDRLLSDAGLRARLGAQSRRLFESSLMWDHNAQRMMEIFSNSLR